MTEQEWLEAADPWEMLAFLEDKASERKLRFFAVACCRRIVHLLEDERSRRAVEVAERYADNLASETERQAAFHDACASRFGGRPIPTRWEDDIIAERAFRVAYWSSSAPITALDPSPIPLAEVARQVAFETATAIAAAVAASAPGDADEVQDIQAAAQDTERAIQAGLLRDLFGPLPFRETHIDSSVLTWNDGIMVRMATAVYEERSLTDGTLGNAQMAVLADALEEAGCHEENILYHCREQGQVHVRGCWLLDLILQRA